MRGDGDTGRAPVLPGYESLAAVLDEALGQAQNGKGLERHASLGERFEDQQIVQFGEWLGNTGFPIGQACKKAIESARLPHDRARAELLGAINYLAAAIIVLDRRAAGVAAALDDFDHVLGGAS
jgi:hypothetical protein